MQLRVTIIVLTALAALVGCTSTRHLTPQQTQQSLLAAPASSGKHSAMQVIHGAFGSREVSLNAVLNVDQGRLTIVGLTAMGVRVFTLNYDGQTLKVERDLPAPAQLTPEHLLSDVQLVLWPLDALRDIYQSAGLDLSQPFTGTRRVRRGDRIVAEVHYATDDAWNGRAWLVNLEHGYTIALDSKPLENTQ